MIRPLRAGYDQHGDDYMLDGERVLGRVVAFCAPEYCLFSRSAFARKVRISHYAISDFAWLWMPERSHSRGILPTSNNALTGSGGSRHHCVPAVLDNKMAVPADLNPRWPSHPHNFSRAAHYAPSDTVPPNMPRQALGGGPPREAAAFSASRWSPLMKVPAMKRAGTVLSGGPPRNLRPTRAPPGFGDAHWKSVASRERPGFSAWRSSVRPPSHCGVVEDRGCLRPFTSVRRPCNVRCRQSVSVLVCSAVQSARTPRCPRRGISGRCPGLLVGAPRPARRRAPRTQPKSPQALKAEGQGARRRLLSVAGGVSRGGRRRKTSSWGGGGQASPLFSPADEAASRGDRSRAGGADARRRASSGRLHADCRSDPRGLPLNCRLQRVGSRLILLPDHHDRRAKASRRSGTTRAAPPTRARNTAEH